MSFPQFESKPISEYFKRPLAALLTGALAFAPAPVSAQTALTPPDETLRPAFSPEDAPEESAASTVPQDGSAAFLMDDGGAFMTAASNEVPLQYQSRSSGWGTKEGPSGTGYVAFTSGKYLDYRLEAPASGDYRIEMSVKNYVSSGWRLPPGFGNFEFSVYVDGVYKGRLPVPASDTEFQTANFVLTDVAAGPHTVRITNRKEVYDAALKYDSNPWIDSVKAFSESAEPPAEDTTPPVITGTAASNVTSSSAQISWTTDEPGDSKVEVFDGTNWVAKASSASLAVNHELTISGLAAETAYQVRVRSKDAAGNEKTGTPFTVTTTAAEAAVPLTYHGRSSGWGTKEGPSGLGYVAFTSGKYLEYRLEVPSTGDYRIEMSVKNYVSAGWQLPPNFGNFEFNVFVDGTYKGVLSVPASDAGFKQGSFLLERLASGAHTVRLANRKEVYNSTLKYDSNPWVDSVKAYSSDGTPPPQDTTPPVISGVNASNITQTSALIKWTTDEAGDSKVEIYNGTSWAAKASAAALVTSHSLTVSGLTAGTSYQARVRSKDAAGNEKISTPFNFETAPDTVSDFTMGVSTASATIQSASIDWNITGDADHDAKAAVRYREAGTTVWKPSLDLFRIDYNGADKFSGSIMGLTGGKTYEVEVKVTDPDGGSASKIMTVATRKEPSLPANGRVLHVKTTGTTTGAGTEASPYSLAKAQSMAQPGDTILIHAGTYPASFFDKGGTPDNYVVYKGAGDGIVLFSSGLEVRKSHIWVEGLTVHGASDGEALVIRTDSAATDVVIKSNRVEQCNYCIRLKGTGTPPSSNYYIVDNEIKGDTPAFTDTDVGEGIELDTLGTGHVVAYNRISEVADGISYPKSNVDIYGNDIFDTSDDGIEMDFAGSNIRIWGNRIHNVRKNSLSFQPQSGGPWYIFKNQIMGWGEGPIKFRTTDRFFFAHNTIVGLQSLSGPDFNSFYHFLRAYSRNNLWISSYRGEMYDFSPPSQPTALKDWRTDIDYSGFYWGADRLPFSYNGTRYADIAAFAAATGMERNGVKVSKDDFEELLFPGPALVPIPPQHLTLKAGAAAVDKGVVLPGVNDGFTGMAPDLGAYERGKPLPQYGPRSPVPPRAGPGIYDVRWDLQANETVIKWRTGVPSTSQVRYGPNSSYGSSTPVDTALVTEHSVRLTGLTPNNTLYYFQVRSKDASGREQYTRPFHFRTLSAPNTPPVINSLTYSGASDTNASRAGVQIPAGTGTVNFAGSASDAQGNTITYEWIGLKNGAADYYRTGTGAIPAVPYDFSAAPAGTVYDWLLKVTDKRIGDPIQKKIRFEIV